MDNQRQDYTGDGTECVNDATIQKTSVIPITVDAAFEFARNGTLIFKAFTLGRLQMDFLQSFSWIA
ncbi:hypothetical protein DW194_13135 [Subdoligranulum sp. AM16-9]|nr:hypothetical protein DW194_13135 [Subdoligranulum sp. AM16-9]